ncbi:MAG: hypothetical protein JWO30_3118 [Fibrobacteres bacterium]|nr:hypothetical protein [Fibrobacterota bacterium]
MENGTDLTRGGSGKTSAWLLGIFLAGTAVGALAFDLTPDRGPVAASLSSGNSSVSFNVWNVGKDDWGPVNNCGTTWADAQWRDEAGKRIGSVVPKTVVYQTDFNPITNGWFTPNPSRPYMGCAGSHISRGWDDEYYNTLPSSASISHTAKPTVVVKVDPANLNSADENLNNNRVWVTTQWNVPLSLFIPMETVELAAGTTTLVSSDSLYYGAYSTNSTYGKIYITAKARTNNLTSANELIGYQGRQMVVTVTGATANVYTIQNGAKVQADFLGQNHY